MNDISDVRNAGTLYNLLLPDALNIIVNLHWGEEPLVQRLGDGRTELTAFRLSDHLLGTHPRPFPPPPPRPVELAEAVEDWDAASTGCRSPWGASTASCSTTFWTTRGCPGQAGAEVGLR